MHTLEENETLLKRFIDLANAKGAHFSHFIRTPNGRIRLFYRDSMRRDVTARNFLTFTEALEHIYIAYNLKRQIPFKRLEAKNLNVPKTPKEHVESAFEQLMEELYPQKD